MVDQMRFGFLYDEERKLFAIGYNVTELQRDNSYYDLLASEAGRNRYQTVTARTAIKKIRTATDKKDAQSMLPKVFSLLDRLAKKSVIHKNKAANLKSELAVHVNKMK